MRRKEVKRGKSLSHLSLLLASPLFPSFFQAFSTMLKTTFYTFFWCASYTSPVIWQKRSFPKSPTEKKHLFGTRVPMGRARWPPVPIPRKMLQDTADFPKTVGECFQVLFSRKRYRKSGVGFSSSRRRLWPGSSYEEKITRVVLSSDGGLRRRGRNKGFHEIFPQWGLGGEDGRKSPMLAY